MHVATRLSSYCVCDVMSVAPYMDVCVLSLRPTFSLVLSSSNISWISTRQSSCMLWKESWGMVAITASSMADSCSRMQEKEGRTWGSWSQHSGHTHCNVKTHYSHVYCSCNQILPNNVIDNVKDPECLVRLGTLVVQKLLSHVI